jgi:type IV pilus assembly protein PilC
MPLLRGLRILNEQEENRTLKRVVGKISIEIENGSSLAEALSLHPKIFNRLYVNMVKAGEIGGALETTLARLADFMEKAEKIKGKVKAAMFYPGAVLVVAFGILTVLMAFVVPRFQQVFEGLLEGRPLPAFSRLVFKISDVITHQLWVGPVLVAGFGLLFMVLLQTTWGRWSFDRFKLTLPVLGSLFRKAAISRFSRTLGTLISNGVPILQSLLIVKETTGNVAVGQLVSLLHENVKQGDPLAPTLRASNLFPAMVAGMVDVGEQTGALPEMLLKIADTYDTEVDSAASALTSLLEPIMIVFLAVIVGSIVIAMFLPIVAAATGSDGPIPGRAGE